MGLNRLMMGGSSSGLPSEETFLWNEENVGIPSDPTFTVPQGVNVLKVSVQVQENTGEQDYYVGLYIIHQDDSFSNPIYWAGCQAFNGETASDTAYIGVTPNKDYTLIAYSYTNQDGICNYLRISYSASINRQTPTVTDY